MDRKVVILRDLSSPNTHGPVGRGRGVGPSARDFGPDGRAPAPEPRIDVADLSTRELRDLARDPEVTSIATVMPTRLIAPVAEDAAANPAAAGNSWGIAAVKADTSPFTGAGVVVCVLDTGIDPSHPAFAGVTLVQEDFSGSGNGDGQGHGTHCAGTIFGRDLGGARIGIARGVRKALIGKVLDNNGSGSSDMIFQGIRWALENDAHVISMSLGFDFPGLVKELVTANGMPIEAATSEALEAYRANLRMFDALMAMARARQAFAHGSVVIAAAGNESSRNANPAYEVAAAVPSAAEGVVSVAALQQGAGGLTVASFSNTFAQISAPGVSILSAKPGGGTQTMSGTSMACPHVAGISALWWEAVLAGAVPPTATMVVAKLLANAATTGLAAGVDLADRGAGIAITPQ